MSIKQTNKELGLILKDKKHYLKFYQSSTASPSIKKVSRSKQPSKISRIEK